MEPANNKPQGIVLETRNLYAGYKDVTIVYDVSIKVHAAEILTVIGPNGAGKSTLLKAIGGGLNKVSGEVLLNGQDILGWSSPKLVRNGATIVPQTDNVFPSLSIMENLEMGGYILKKGLKRRIAEVIDLFPELKERTREPASVLSGGQRQTLAMARALMLEPILLLLDEPTAALSPIARIRIFEEIVKIRNSGVAVVMVEQNALEALSVSDTGCVMVAGRKVREGEGRAMSEAKDIGELFVGSDREKG